jgi:hypothetical protein
MTLRAFETLYESSVAFGMRKALMAEQGKSELERKVCANTIDFTVSDELFDLF